MKKQNTLITQESTEVVLRKATNIINRTNKILKNSKRELVTHSDVMMLNGLMWQKETVKKEMNWNDAMEYAKNLRLGGYDNWRLPTIEEFRKIIHSCGGIEISISDKDWVTITNKNNTNKSYQSCYKSKRFISGDYWSGSMDTHNYYVAWLIGFNNGGSHNSNMIYTCSVRCVRAGEE